MIIPLPLQSSNAPVPTPHVPTEEELAAIPVQEYEQKIVEWFGFEYMPLPFQHNLLSKVGEMVMQNSLSRFVEEMSPEDEEKLSQIMNEGTDEMSIFFSQLYNNFPQFQEIVKEETILLRDVYKERFAEEYGS